MVILVHATRALDTGDKPTADDSSDSDTLDQWSITLHVAVTHMTATDRFIALGCQDGSVHMFSTTGMEDMTVQKTQKEKSCQK